MTLSLERFADERLTFDEVAALIGVTTQAVRRWVSVGMHGFPRGVKVGRYRYFLRSEVDAWLESRRGL